MHNLTPREHDVLKLVVSGRSTKKVAHELGISFRTAVCHRYRLFQKLEVHNTAELIVKSLRLGLVNLTDDEVPPRHSSLDSTPRGTGASGPEDEWRQCVDDARLRLQSASERSRESWEQLKSRGLPSADGTFAYGEALMAESAALDKYRRTLRIYTSLVLHGKMPE